MMHRVICDLLVLVLTMVLDIFSSIADPQTFRTIILYVCKVKKFVNYIIGNYILEYSGVEIFVFQNISQLTPSRDNQAVELAKVSNNNNLCPELFRNIIVWNIIMNEIENVMYILII